MHEWIVTSGTVRLNDDAGDNPGAEAPWSSFLAANGSKTINNINILNGCQAATEPLVPGSSDRDQRHDVRLR